jgi:hypothetical protein
MGAAGGAIPAAGASPSPSPAPIASPSPLPLPPQVPAQLLGNQVQRENIAPALSGNTRQIYFDHVDLYSVRRSDNFLQATLEIGRFKRGTDYGAEYFQRSLVDQIGSSQPTANLVGSDLVYITTAKGLVVASWFRGNHLVILSIRDTFDLPKTLIRQALPIKP